MTVARRPTEGRWRHVRWSDAPELPDRRSGATRRKGPDADQPHRVQYKKLVRA